MYQVDPRDDDLTAVTWRYAPSSREHPMCYLIDREPGVRRLVAALLESCRIDVEVFDSLDRIPQAPRDREPDLVLIDATVNPSDALELVEKLAVARLLCPVQLLTGLSPV